MVEMGQPATARDYDGETDAMRRSRGRAAAIRAAARDAERRSILARTVELDVVPRLLLMRRAEPDAAVVAAEVAAVLVTQAQVTDLARITLLANEAATGLFVMGLRAGGLTAETAYLDLLSPAARLLGQWWEDDVCDFTQVTIGLWRLQNAMRALSPAFLGTAMAADPGGARPRALLVPVPGEQHTFGLAMVHDFFSRGGWDAWSGPVADRAQLGAMLRHQWIDVVGFSLACDERLGGMPAEIEAVRQASRNRAVAVMVGGPPFIGNPGLAAEIGADGTAENGLQAVAAANALLGRAAARG